MTRDFDKFTAAAALKPHFDMMVADGLTEGSYGTGHKEKLNKWLASEGYVNTFAFAFTGPGRKESIGLLSASRTVTADDMKEGRQPGYSDWKSETLTPEQFATWRKDRHVGFGAKFDAAASQLAAHGYDFAPLTYKAAPLPGDWSSIRESISWALNGTNQRIQDALRSKVHVPAKWLPACRESLSKLRTGDGSSRLAG